MNPLVLDIPGTTTKPFTTTLAVDGALLDLVSEELRFPSPGRVEVRVEPVNAGFMLDGVLEIAVGLACSRCLSPVSWQVRERFRMVLSRDPAGGDTEDEWVYFARDEREFDLSPLVRDLVSVCLPVKPLCDDECAGLCPRCGIDKNREQCDCVSRRVDPRWATLTSLRLDRDPPPDKEENSHGAAEEKDIED